MSPRSKKQLQVLREEKQTFIMDAALEHFARDGYHNTTIKHLARHARISTGLLYNYFESKEELLNKIVIRSLKEMSEYLDPDKDGFLNEEEFEFLIRKLFHALREKRSSYQLFFQMILQKEVRDRVLNSFVYPVLPEDKKYPENRFPFPLEVSKYISEYFKKKVTRKQSDYDAILDMRMFVYTVEGFAMISVFLDKTNDDYYEKTIDKIIEQYR